MGLAPVNVDARTGELKLVIDWGVDGVGEIPFRLLRAKCQCAMCVHEFTREVLVKYEDIDPEVKIVAMHPVGHYAVNIHFSDGHHTGIYTWRHLRGLMKIESESD